MKYINTLLKLKNLKLKEFIEIICDLHQIEEYNEDEHIFQNEHLHYIQIEHYIAFKIFDYFNEYEYIYDGSRLFIHVDLTYYDGYVDVMGYLYEHDFVDEFLIDDYSEEELVDYIVFKCDKPVVYLYQEYSALKESLAIALKGIAFVVGSNDKLHHLLKKQYHLKKGVYIFFLNHECIKLYQYSLENQEKFIERIIMKVKDYVNQRSFDFPFSYNELYSYALKQIHNGTKENEKRLLNDIESQLLDEEMFSDEIKEKINAMQNKIDVIKNMNEVYQENIDAYEYYPLLLKGDIEEFYENEQKDMILSILDEELDYEHDPKVVDIIHDILASNKPGTIRQALLKEIRNILFNGKNSQYVERLKKCGIHLEKNGKHYDGKFFNHPKYSITIASTASDVNASHEIFRQIRNYFF